MIASARKMKRTKRQELLLAETMNGNAINQLLKQHISLAEDQQMIAKEIVKFQKEILAIKNALISRGFLTELEIARHRSEFDEIQRMESQALLIGGDKK